MDATADASEKRNYVTDFQYLYFRSAPDSLLCWQKSHRLAIAFALERYNAVDVPERDSDRHEPGLRLAAEVDGMVESNSVWTSDVDDSQVTLQLLVLTLETEVNGADDENLGTDPYNSGVEKAVRKSAGTWRQ